MKSLSIGLLSLALATVGCAKTNPAITVHDLGGTGGDGSMNNKQDGGNGKPDLSMNGGDDASMPGNCTMVANWPGLMPQGGYDATNVVTFAATTDVMNPPFNALTVEDYHGNGIPYPKMHTYSKTDTYSGCDVCTLIQVCDAMSCTQTYFAQGGTINVTQSDQNAAMGSFKATASNLTLVEWDFNGDAAVMNGKCIQIASATFDVSWSAPPPDDGGMPPSDGGGGKGDMAQNLGCTPVINELQTAGASASDEFIEIFNPCNAAVDMTGWKIGYRSAGNNKGGADTALFSFPANTMIQPGGFYVAAGMAFTGKADAMYASGMAAGGGAIGLKDPNGNVVDSVSYDVLTAPNNFTEGMPAPNPAASTSIGRHMDGNDNNNNLMDFTKCKTPTPDAMNN
jgi:hypothetical protein